MKDNIDDRLRYKGTQLTGVMPDVGNALDNITFTYTQFLNSADKVERLKLLGNLRLAAIDCQNKCKALIEFFGGNVFAGPLPSINKGLADRVQYSIKYAQPGLDVGKDNYLHGALLSLTQLAKYFVGIAPKLVAPQEITREEKAFEVVQYLFNMHNVCDDIAELCLITQAEPEKKLVDS
jgi:hypothetical protein